MGKERARQGKVGKGRARQGKVRNKGARRLLTMVRSDKMYKATCPRKGCVLPRTLLLPSSTSSSFFLLSPCLLLVPFYTFPSFSSLNLPSRDRVVPAFLVWLLLPPIFSVIRSKRDACGAARYVEAAFFVVVVDSTSMPTCAPKKISKLSLRMCV